MDALEAIRTRRSVRKFQDRPVSEEQVRQVLAAAMMAPSARNSQPWHFIVIDNRAMLADYAQKHRNAEMAAIAPVAILVCGDLTLELSPGYWPVDCAAAAENLLLAAHAIGLGAVWTGVYPREDRMGTLQRMCKLPDHIMPHSLIVIGHPDEAPISADRYRTDRVRRNTWG